MIQYDKDYLLGLIQNQIEESLHLDYKASGALGKQNDKTGEISKDVSAMANADGGIIIYGLKEDSINRHLPKEIDGVLRKEFSKEWIEQTINDKIQPRIKGIKIYSIPIENDHVVYVIDVPKSDTAHQALDKRYYKRFNFLSTAMHDYEIRDILNRSKHPQIDLDFKYNHQSSKIDITAINNGSVYANYLNVRVRLPKSIVVDQYHKLKDNKTVEIFMDNTIRDVVDVQIIGLGQVSEKYGPSRYDPILPGTQFHLKSIEIHNYPFDHENILEWEVICDNANSRAGAFRLHELLDN